MPPIRGGLPGLFVWLNADYRRDRNLLKGVTPSGRLRRKELECLRDALKWPPAKVNGVWPFNDAWLRTSL